MAPSFFFYDLETSGLNPRYDRIMQFAGQRTDMDLKPIGKPVNLLVKLSEDILPSPEALLVTGITPQQTASDGVSEAEFTKILSEEIFLPNTVTVGFNNIRFDDEFIRHILWRNFYDPYEWSWLDGRSRWDMLDVSRMVRALRPDGINWPMDDRGQPTNKLELLAKANRLKHAAAHDALSDVGALIALTQLIRDKQPKMFDYLFKMRGKNEITKLVNLDEPQPFVYASGRYDTVFEKTTVALAVAPGRRPGTVLVYDLRIDLSDQKQQNYSASHAVESRDEKTSSIISESPKHNSAFENNNQEVFSGDSKRVQQNNSVVSQYQPWPVKELAYNRCPAVAPLGVMDEAAWERIGLDLDQVQVNLKKLQKNRGTLDKIMAAWNDRPDFPAADDVEGQLYDSFTPDADKSRVRKVRETTPDELADLHLDFNDERLPELLLRYKARNFPQSLSESEQTKWEEYRSAKFERELPGYMNRLAQLAVDPVNKDKQFVFEEIQIWAESIVPVK
jgi:exodeoxyribonuclease-1